MKVAFSWVSLQLKKNCQAIFQKSNSRIFKGITRVSFPLFRDVFFFFEKQFPPSFEWNFGVRHNFSVKIITMIRRFFKGISANLRLFQGVFQGRFSFKGFSHVFKDSGVARHFDSARKWLPRLPRVKVSNKRCMPLEPFTNSIIIPALTLDSLPKITHIKDLSQLRLEGQKPLIRLSLTLRRRGLPFGKINPKHFHPFLRTQPNIQHEAVLPYD